MDLKSHDYSRYAIVRSIEDWVCNQIEYDDDDEKENKLVVANGNEKASVDTFYRISQDNNNNKAYYMHINNSGSYVIGGLHSLQGSQTTHDDSDVERSNCGNCSRHCPDGCSSCSGFKNCSNNNCSVADGRGDDSKVKLYIISNDLPPYPNAALNILDFVDFEFNVGHFLPTPAARKLVVKVVVIVVVKVVIVVVKVAIVVVKVVIVVVVVVVVAVVKVVIVVVKVAIVVVKVAIVVVKVVIVVVVVVIID